MRPVSVSQLLYGSAALSVAAASALPEDDTPLPLVIWHGTSPIISTPPIDAIQDRI